MKDPLAGSSWSEPGTVAGFAQSSPNPTLMRFATDERRAGGRRAVDIGCGAGRNALPVAGLGWDVVGLDLSWPMMAAAARRAAEERPTGRVYLALAPMEALPVQGRTVDLIIAHGVWNLARSSAQFRQGVREAARIARPGAALFVFTFSRTTLLPEVQPVPGEPFVFTEFSGAPQCFLTAPQLLAELADAGFVPDPAVPLTEHNLPRPGSIRSAGPVIYEGAFRYRA
jgi:SAM-dependent methyltransferase